MKKSERKVVLMDYEELEDWQRLSVTNLAKAMFFDEVYGQKLLKAVEKLPEIEKNVISLHYGLEGGKCKTLKQISLEYETTVGKINIIEERAIRMLLFNYDAIINPDSIGNLKISMRLYLALKRARYTSIKELKEMTLQELKQIRYLGTDSLKDLQEVLEQHQEN